MRGSGKVIVRLPISGDKLAGVISDFLPGKKLPTSFPGVRGSALG